MRVLNVGSINIDWVHHVDRFTEPGQTVAASRFTRGPGGKGANQSVALARAGAGVWHAGCVGRDGGWLVEGLADEGVDTGLVRVDPTKHTGHAMIQVTPDGQNAIVVSPGANGAITQDAIHEAVYGFGPGDWCLVQNEVNAVEAILQTAKQRGMRLVVNPAPVDTHIREILRRTAPDLLIVNRGEAQSLLEGVPREDQDIAFRLSHEYQCAVLMTLGEYGALHVSEQQLTRVAAETIQAVDTTAAGDTFIGFFVAGLAQGMPLPLNLERATRAAALCCCRPGATDAIPRLHELERAFT